MHPAKTQRERKRKRGGAGGREGGREGDMRKKKERTSLLMYDASYDR